MANNELFTEIVRSLEDRSRWENRQNTWYEMRHNGLRRKKLPFPGAADLHYPMSDSMIEKHKPFYYQLLFGQDLIALFNSLEIAKQVDATGVAHWFDYKLKQKTNIETEILVAIDFMLMCGRSILKTTYDVDAKKLRYGGIDPVFFIVPSYTEDLREADFITEVKQMSKDQYIRLGGKYNQDADYIRRITGTNQYDTQKMSTKYRREGINVPQDGNQIIIWETYEQTADKKWKITWCSPALPNEDARPPQMLVSPYKAPPYSDFFTEVKDKGFYSPRGIPEIVATFEAYLTKMLNESADFMTFTNRPLYTSENAIVNMQNYKLIPGQYVPNNLTRVQQGPPPMPFEEQETKMRSIAEYRVGMPDFQMGNQANARGQDRGNPTATEVNAITNLMGQTVDLRVRLFRKSLSQVYQQSWDLLRYYEKDSLEYFQKKEMKKISPEILDLDYSIDPSGSVDNMNRQMVLQKASMRRDMFRGVPWINQQELDKSVLEADDPRLVDRLFIDPNDVTNEQAEEQADEIGNMLNGFPVKISQEDDDMIHLVTGIQWVQMHMAEQKPIDGKTANLAMQHFGAHHDRLLSTPEGKAKIKGLSQGVLGAVIGYLQAMSGQGAPQGQPQAALPAPAGPPQLPAPAPAAPQPQPVPMQ